MTELTPAASRFELVDRLPVDCERLFSVHPPVLLPDGRSADYVVAGTPMESWMGPDYSLQVFAADSGGQVIDWAEPVWDATAGVDTSPAGWPAGWLDVMMAGFS